MWRMLPPAWTHCDQRGALRPEDTVTQPDPPASDETLGLCTWDDLRSTGMLWLINRVVFHPHGWALALVYKDAQVVGWTLQGDGREVWRFEGDEDDLFAKAQAMLAPAGPDGGRTARPLVREPVDGQ